MGLLSGARREWALVVLVAVAGVVLASLVAFVPWYEPASLATPEAVPAERAADLTAFLGAMFSW